MLYIYLQEYDTSFLEQLATLCRECIQPDWDARVQSENETSDELLNSIRVDERPALFVMEDTNYDVLDKTVGAIRLINALHYIVLRINFAEDAVRVRPAHYRACGFLLAPINKVYLHALLASIYSDFASISNQYGGYFSFKISDTVYQVPYSKITYFESSSKKILMRTAAQEYEFYESLNEIISSAPDYFVRVHRGFCVNVRKIDSLDIANKTITMQDGSIVPFSRTFRKKLLDAIGG